MRAAVWLFAFMAKRRASGGGEKASKALKVKEEGPDKDSLPCIKIFDALVFLDRTLAPAL